MLIDIISINNRSGQNICKQGLSAPSFGWVEISSGIKLRACRKIHKSQPCLLAQIGRSGRPVQKTMLSASRSMFNAAINKCHRLGATNAADSMIHTAPPLPSRPVHGPRKGEKSQASRYLAASALVHSGVGG